MVLARLGERIASILARFRRIFQYRADYYCQLQELNDSVQEVAVPSGTTLKEMLASNELQIKRSEALVKTLGARLRYLRYIGERTTGNADSAVKGMVECGICKSHFEKGCLLACGHLFCLECLNACRRSGHQLCPGTMFTPRI